MTTLYKRNYTTGEWQAVIILENSEDLESPGGGAFLITPANSDLAINTRGLAFATEGVVATVVANTISSALLL